MYKTMRWTSGLGPPIHAPLELQRQKREDITNVFSIQQSLGSETQWVLWVGCLAKVYRMIIL